MIINCSLGFRSYFIWLEEFPLWKEHESALNKNTIIHQYLFFFYIYGTLQNPQETSAPQWKPSRRLSGKYKTMCSPYLHESRAEGFSCSISNHKQEHAFTDSANLLSLIKRCASLGYPQEFSHCWVYEVGLKFSVNGGKISYTLWWNWLISDAR